MKIANLNILRKFRRPEARPKPERTHYGIKIVLPESLSDKELLSWLINIPPNVYKMPEGQSIAFDFGGRLCSRNLILHMLQSIVWEKGLKITAWLSSSPESIKLLSSAGLSVTEPVPELDIPEVPERRQAGMLKIVHTSMRSGQSVRTDGDVLVWGHLNPGAEITAGGSVIVAGRLLGVVHAGAFGREDVFVWAGSFETPQVRIGHKLCYADAKSTKSWKRSVLITLEDGEPVIREHKFIGGQKV